MKYLLVLFFLPSVYVCSLDLDKLKNLCRSTLPCWAEEKLNEDFRLLPLLTPEEFNQELSQLVNYEHLVLVHIQQQKISFSSVKGTELNLKDLSSNDRSRLSCCLNALRYLCNAAKIPSCRFVMSLADHFSYSSKIPVFTFAKLQGTLAVTIPDFEALGGYSQLRSIICQGSALYPFEKKHDQAFWRGTTTGVLENPSQNRKDHWDQLPRGKLVVYSLNHSDLLDAKFSQIAELPKKKGLELKKELKKKQLFSSFVSVKDHFAYKYLIDIDGNSCTYSRLFWILSSNSLCIKQESNHEQWYYKALVPYKNFIPFKKDFSDLADQIIWAKTHQNNVLEIIAQANKIAEQIFTHESVLAYLYHAILRASFLY